MYKQTIHKILCYFEHNDKYINTTIFITHHNELKLHSYKLIHLKICSRGTLFLIHSSSA